MIFRWCRKAGVSGMKDNNDAKVVNTTVTRIKDDGSLLLDISPEDLNKKGIMVGDEVYVDIDGESNIHVAFVELPSYAGLLGLCLCDYEGKHKEITLKIYNGSFSERIGGNIGSNVKITLKTKNFIEFPLKSKMAYTESATENCTLFEYSNFRMIKAGNIKSGVLYRGCSLLNYNFSKGRISAAVKLCQESDIRTIIDLSDSDQDVNNYLSSPINSDSYVHKVKKQNSLFNAKLSQDFFCEKTTAELARAFRFIISHEPPFLIHCNEGKDRTGLVCILIEALLKADIDEIVNDYMLSYKNYYEITENDYEYQFLRDMIPLRFLTFLSQYENLNDINEIDGDSMKFIPDKDYSLCARKYMIEQVNMTEEEVDDIVLKLS